MHMPAGPIDTAHESTSAPAPSDDTAVRPDVSRSLCPPGGSFKGGARSLMLLLATAASGAPFHEAVRGLRESGVHKIILGEEHTLPGRYGLIANTLQAVNTGGVNFYREFVTFDEATATTMERDWMLDDRRIFVAAALVQDSPGQGVITVDEKRAFVAAAMRPNVTTRIMNWLPQRNDTTRFIEDQTFAIASMGAAHALFEPIGYDPSMVVLMAPFLGDFSVGPDLESSRNFLPLSKGTLPLNWDEQDECFNTFSRAQSVAPTMFLTTSNLWAALAKLELSVEPDGEIPGPSGLRDRFIKYYNDQNYAVLEVPLPSVKQFNATMIVPAQFLPQLQEFAARHPKRVRLYAEGLPVRQPAPASTTAPARSDL
jgi:hypothetical protein